MLLVAGLGVGVTIVLVSRFVGSDAEVTTERQRERPRAEASAGGVGLPSYLLRPPQDAPVPPPAYPDSAQAGGADDNDDADVLTIMLTFAVVALLGRLGGRSYRW